ncbi:hypothetical protein [Lonsdalea quercina]|uniref:gp53-like domain-containing protein n=1 Tax=Lonsdalea quercina TaxID=71657 RepID=UPI003974DBA0
MSSGTIALTNNSITVTGTSTSFSSDLTPGDYIVTVVGGVTYTLPVKTVDSVTQVTLIKAYDGPTTSGAAWNAVPRDAMSAITAQLAAETAKALRGLNYDKANWQQVFSGSGDITVTLPDGSTYTGPAWNNAASKGANSDITSLSGLTTPLNIGQGGTGATSAPAARSSLGLGTAATSNVSGSGDLTAISLFDSYKNGTSGWQKLPNGLIIQWGQMAVGNGEYYAAYPLAFSSIASAASVNFYGDFDLSNATLWKMTSENLNTSLKIGVSGLSQVAAVSWIVIGY